MDLQTSQAAVDRIIADLSDRRGLRGEWDQIDADIQTEIRDNWSRILREAVGEPTPAPPPNPLAQAIADALNRHSAENGSNTPDFILAEFLMSCLAAFDAAQAGRTRWYAREDEPTPPPVEPPGTLSEAAIRQILATLTERARTAMGLATSVQELYDQRAGVIGPNGELSSILRSMGPLSTETRREVGQRVNVIREEITRVFEDRLTSLRRSV